MTNNHVKRILDRVLSWPTDRQDAAALVLSAMEEQDASSYRLSDEQVEEVERRLADGDRKFIAFEEVQKRFAQRRA